MPVIACWAEKVAGFGWQNHLVYILSIDPTDGKLTMETVQPEDQTVEMKLLSRVSDATNREMINAVERRKQGKFVWVINTTPPGAGKE